jgi:hypothetical protein
MGPERNPNHPTLDPSEPRWALLGDNETSMEPYQYALQQFKYQMAIVVNNANNDRTSRYDCEHLILLPTGESRESYIRLMERLSNFLE